MWREILVLCMVALVAASTSSLEAPAYVPGMGHFVILIHDVSPVYLNQLKEITAVISSYGLQNVTYLWVIPDHAGRYPIWKYPAFVSYLESLRAQGYHIELHGYNHIGDEFDCNASVAEKKLELGLKALSYLNVTPRYFIAPRYSLSPAARKVLLSHNLTIIGKRTMYLPNGEELPIDNVEYTWYMCPYMERYELLRAECNYGENWTMFLSLHPRAVNNRAGMEFLREFLAYVSQNKKEKG